MCWSGDLTCKSVQEEAVVADAQRETRSALDSLAAAQADGRQVQQCLGLLVGGLAPLISLDKSTQHALTSCESAESFNLYLQQLLQQVCAYLSKLPSPLNECRLHMIAYFDSLTSGGNPSESRIWPMTLSNLAIFGHSLLHYQ